MTRDEAYQKAQAIIIKHVDREISDVQAVQLIAEAILAAASCPTCGRIHECSRFPTES